MSAGRTTLSVVVAVAVGILCLAPPVVAHPQHASDSDVQELEQALRAAPLERRGSCDVTIAVEGQGPSCKTIDGQWRVEAGGDDFVSHGPDVGALAGIVINVAPQVQSVLDAADHTSVACAVNVHTPRYVAIYARPAGAPDRHFEVIPRFRNEIYRASAFIGAAAADDGGAGRVARLRFECSGDEVAVHEAQLSTPAGATTMATIISDLTSLGFESPYSLDSSKRFLVYYDGVVGPGPFGYGGQAGIAATFGAGGPENSGNLGGFFAVNYAHSIGRPDWPIILHEILHNMGAVAEDAPQSTGDSAHCTVDADIMCYTDEAGIPTTQVCTYTELDCGSDTYFHAGSPAPG
ncbi:MAG: Ricin lectin, partial [Thermoleophilia bacterium]|nr:Ricin lectin [Thermoleophilia bacterium]